MPSANPERALAWATTALGLVGGLYVGALLDRSGYVNTAIVALTTGGTCAFFGWIAGRHVDEPLHFAALGLVAGAINGALCGLFLLLGQGDRHLLPVVVVGGSVVGSMVAIPFTPWLAWIRAASNQQRLLRRGSLLAGGGARALIVPVAVAATTGAVVSHLLRGTTQLEMAVAALGAVVLLALAAFDTVDLARATKLRARWERAEPQTAECPVTIVDFGRGEERRAEPVVFAAPYRAQAQEVLFVGDGEVAVWRIRRRMAIDLAAAALAAVLVTLFALGRARDPSHARYLHDSQPPAAAPNDDALPRRR